MQRNVGNNCFIDNQTDDACHESSLNVPTVPVQVSLCHFLPSANCIHHHPSIASA